MILLPGCRGVTEEVCRPSSDGEWDGEAVAGGCIARCGLGGSLFGGAGSKGAVICSGLGSDG